MPVNSNANPNADTVRLKLDCLRMARSLLPRAHRRSTRANRRIRDASTAKVMRLACELYSRINDERAAPAPRAAGNDRGAFEDSAQSRGGDRRSARRARTCRVARIAQAQWNAGPASQGSARQSPQEGCGRAKICLEAVDKHPIGL